MTKPAPSGGKQGTAEVPYVCAVAVGYVTRMNPSFPFDPALHDPGSSSARGRCSWHDTSGAGTSESTPGDCQGEAVVSFRDGQGQWQSGCQLALEELVSRHEIQPLGQGA